MYETIKKLFIEMVIEIDSINYNESTLVSDDDEYYECRTVNRWYIP